MSEERDLRPSEATDRFWIEAEREKGNYPAPTERSGKWLVFVAPRNVDEVWAKVRIATKAGRLGHRAKVSTALQGKIAANLDAAGSTGLSPEGTVALVRWMRERNKVRVICVYTYDWTDEADVRRVRRALRRLGIDGRIPYKADEDTLTGKYRATGDKELSRYFE